MVRIGNSFGTWLCMVDGMSELKIDNCPFCGHDGELVGSKGGFKWVMCPECEARGPLIEPGQQCSDDDCYSAAYMWNNNKLASKNKRLREALVELVETSMSNERQLAESFLEKFEPSSALIAANKALNATDET